MELGRITQGLLNLLDVSLMHVMLYHHKAIWTVVGGNTITGHLYLGDQFTLIMTLMVFNTYQKPFLPKTIFFLHALPDT